MRKRYRRGVLPIGLFALVAGGVLLTLLVGSSSAANGTCTANSPQAGQTTCVFSSTGNEQTFTVPTGVTTVHVDAIGAAGAAHADATGGGSGAEVAGDVSVTPGNTLYVEVGGTATNDTTLCYASTPCVGGWNGGGSDAGSSQSVLGSAGGGGGASDVRTVAIGNDPSPGNGTSLDSRVLVAAGGGGGSSTDQCTGGDGGDAGSSGGDGSNCGIDATGSGGGAGGTNAGGSAGLPDGNAGAQGQGGSGKIGLGDGGAGGGGLYGGGGGAGGQGNTDCSNPPNCVVTYGGAGGGGGGSNLLPSGGSSKVTTASAEVAITYNEPATPTPTQTSTPAPTQTPTPTNTPAPTQTPTPTATPTPTPSNALGVGYWKNHLANSNSQGPSYSTDCATVSKSGGSCSATGPWAIQRLPQNLGNFPVADIITAAQIFRATNCSSTKDQDAIGCLAGQLLATKLNLANGSPACPGILQAVADADALLKGINYIGPGVTYGKLTSTQRSLVVSLKNALSAYNDKGKCPAVGPAPTIITHVSATTAVANQTSITDQATLTGSNGTVTGSVAFFVCGPTGSATPCVSGGASAGTKTLSGGVATSDGFTPTAAGTYCLRVEYTPDNLQYSSSVSTVTTNECFTAVVATATPTPTQNVTPVPTLPAP